MIAESIVEYSPTLKIKILRREIFHRRTHIRAIIIYLKISGTRLDSKKFILLVDDHSRQVFDKLTFATTFQEISVKTFYTIYIIFEALNHTLTKLRSVQWANQPRESRGQLLLIFSIVSLALASARFLDNNPVSAAIASINKPQPVDAAEKNPFVMIHDYHFLNVYKYK